MKNFFRYFFNFGLALEFLLFAVGIFLSLDIALNLNATAPLVLAANPDRFFIYEFIIGLVLVTVFLVLILKYYRKAWILNLLFYVAIIDGLLIFFKAYITGPYFVIVGLGLFVLWLAYNVVLMHDLIIVLSISAISAFFGLNLTPNTTIVIVIILAIYDFVAVYKTKHMVGLFKGLSESKVYFALIIPASIEGLFVPVKQVNRGEEYFFLGTGDLAIPAIFSVACLRINLLTGFLTATGALFGLLILYYLFITQKVRKPMPGLPPIIFGSLMGYLLAFLLNL